MDKNKTKRRGPNTIQLLSIVFFVMFTIIFAWVCYMITDVKKANSTIQNGEIRIAVIDGYSTSGSHGTIYMPTYKYVDESGIIYSGTLNWGWEYTEQEVSKHYGETVKIVIDGNGYSVPLTYEIQSLAGYIIADVALGLIVIAMIILFALETTKRAKKVKLYRDLFIKKTSAS